MRVALLSSLDTFESENRELRAHARIGGSTVLRRQAEFALAQGCERIACLAETITPELIEVQHVCEDAGADFHAIRDARPLSGLVKSDDRLLVIADGVVFDGDAASDVLGERRKVLTFPAEVAVPLGFERLDAERAWAGLMLLRGSLVERLADLPHDIDPVSSLLRLSLQAGAATGAVEPSVLSDETWCLINTAESAEKYEEKWLARSVSPASPIAMFNAASDYGALAVFKRHLQPKKAIGAIGSFSAILMVAAGLAGWLGYPIAGLGTLLLAGIFGRFSRTLASIVHQGRGLVGAPKWIGAAYPVLLDGLIVGLATVSVPNSKKIAVFFAIAVLLGLMRLAAAGAARNAVKRVCDFFEERGLVTAILIAGALGGNILLIPQMLALLILGYLLLQTRGVRLTQV